MLEGFTQGINIRIIGSSNLAGTMGEAVSQMDRFKVSAKNLMKIGGGRCKRESKNNGRATFAARQSVWFWFIFDRWLLNYGAGGGGGL